MNNKTVSEIIERAREEEMDGLNLYNYGLKRLPSEIGQLTQLKYIHLNINQLTELPDFFWELSDLEYLDLRDNRLTQLPPKIGKLTNLKWLKLNRNRLVQLLPGSRTINIFERA